MKHFIHIFGRFLPFIIIYLTLFFLIISCDGSTGPDNSDIVLPEKDLTFIDHIQPLFAATCASRSGCHAIDNPQAGLALTDYESIRNHFIQNSSEPLVRIADGANSALYLVLVQDNYLGVPQMPYNGPFLTPNQVNGVKVWINEEITYSR